MVQPMPIRAKFYKVGMLQYISHLDLVRTMTRTLVRTRIPVWYSQGFNPRLKLTFSLPLSIGTQSECEFFDIRLVEPMELEEIKSRVNAALTDEMQITEIYQSERKFSEIEWSEYEIKLTSPKLSEAVADSLGELYSNPLIMLKRSKSGDKEVDISPYITLKECKFENGEITIKALLSADSANYLNPEYIIKAAEQKLGLSLDDPFSEHYSIMRREVYLADKITVFR